MAIQGTEFFRQLEVFSDRYFQANLPRLAAISPWGSERRPLYAKGAIIHYTADGDLDRVLRWFCDPKFAANVSAHAVIVDRRLGTHAELAAGLPLVEALPATVIQCRRPDQRANHAVWANGWTYGIECVNDGELRKDLDGNFCTWRKKDPAAFDWSEHWASGYKTPVRAWDRWWDPITADQAAAVVAVLRYLRYFPGTELRKSDILGHEHVQGVHTLANGDPAKPMGTDKRDPGPTFPLHGVRDSVFAEGGLLEQARWYNMMRIEPQVIQADRVRKLQWAVARACGMAEMPLPDMAWMRFESAMEALPTKKEPFGWWGKLGLWLLGYHIAAFDAPIGDGPILDDVEGDDTETIQTFQRLSGLITDGQPGPITKKALVNRLKDRGIIAS